MLSSYHKSSQTSNFKHNYILFLDCIPKLFRILFVKYSIYFQNTIAVMYSNTYAEQARIQINFRGGVQICLIHELKTHGYIII